MSRRKLMARFEQIPGQLRPHPLRNGLIFLAVVGFVLYSGFSRHIPFTPKSGKVVTAHFDTANNAIPGNRVRVKGVDVGEVESIKRSASGEGADVRMRVDEKGFEVKQDARAHLYWRTLLGRNMYVDLEPGSKDAPPLGDRAIPLDRTTTQVEFDQLLESYQKDSRRGARTFFQQTDKALEGDAAGTAVDKLAPGLAPVAPAMRALRGTNPGTDLPTLVQQGGRAFDALAQDEAALAGVLDAADTTLAVTAARRADLAAMLQDAPATLADTRTTLARLRSTLDVLDPVADDLRPGVRKIAGAAPPARRALAQLTKLTPLAVPALRDLQPALRSLRGASMDGSPFFQDLQPTLQRLQDKILPWADKRDNTTNLRNAEAIGPFFSVLSSSSAQYDAYGHMQRFQAGQGERSAGFLPCKTGFFDPENKDQAIKCSLALTAMRAFLTGAPMPKGKP